MTPRATFTIRPAQQPKRKPRTQPQIKTQMEPSGLFGLALFAYGGRRRIYSSKRAPVFVATKAADGIVHHLMFGETGAGESFFDPVKNGAVDGGD